MRSPGHDPAGVISWHSAGGMRRLRPDRLFEIEGTTSAGDPVYILIWRRTSVSEMAEGAAPLSPVSSRLIILEHPASSSLTFFFGDEPVASLRCRKAFRFRGAPRREAAR